MCCCRCQNFYFLVIAFLQFIPEISTTGGRPSILVPLIFVLAVTAVKDALEDRARHKQDQAKNLATYLVLRNKVWGKILSKNIVVGDLIKVKEGQRSVVGREGQTRSERSSPSELSKGLHLCRLFCLFVCACQDSC